MVLLTLVTTSAVLAQDAGSAPIAAQDVKHDISPPLRDMVAGMSGTPTTLSQVFPLRFPRPVESASTATTTPDGALQDWAAPFVGTTNLLNFDGIAANGSAPPDPNGAVGGTQYVQMVNTMYAVYDKSSGGLLLGPASINSVWSGFGTLCETTNGGDPIVLYDQAAGRWFISQLAYNGGFSSNFQCIAVSTTSDATGTWARYAFDFGSNLPDYPKYGVWPDAYYSSANMFPFAGSFIGAQACAFDRNAMLAGASATKVCIQRDTSVASLLPSDFDGTTAPPAGAPNYFLELVNSNSLGLFKFHVDFANPANSTFTGPTTIPVASYSQACGGGTCIPQAGTGQTLDSLGDRLMNRLAYRNFGDHESLVVNHSVTAGTAAGVRWYEIRNPGGTPAVFQQGTYAPDATYRWMGSIAMDKDGDIAVGYSASSSAIHPAIRYTGRVPGDPAGTLEAESSIIEGAGSQTGGLSRWGDYSGMSVDPSDDCTFWYTTEYIPSNGSFNWHTRVASFKFTSCGGPPQPPDFTISATPSSRTVLRGTQTWYTVTVGSQGGFSEVVTFSVTGLPTSSAALFRPTSVTGSGKSLMTVYTTRSTPPGTYPLTITGTSPSFVHSTPVTLIVR